MKRASWALVFALALTTPADSFGKTDKPKKAKEDVEQIGERNVGKGINFYSIEKEIALGKQLAQEIERTVKAKPSAGVISASTNTSSHKTCRPAGARGA